MSIFIGIIKIAVVIGLMYLCIGCLMAAIGIKLCDFAFNKKVKTSMVIYFITYWPIVACGIGRGIYLAITIMDKVDDTYWDQRDEVEDLFCESKNEES